MMPEYEVEGRCPRCRRGSICRAMPKAVKSLRCDKLDYTFPFRIYWCQYHGYWIWRGNKHELLDFSKIKHEAVRIEEFSPTPGAYTPTLADYLIVKMKCPHCGGKWKQYDKTWTQNGNIFCPFCHAEISKEEAKTQ